MSSDFRRIALIAASLGLLVSLYLALSPDDGDDPASTTTAAAAPPATTEDEVTTVVPPAEPDLELEIRGGRPVGGIRRVKVGRGPVSIRIVTDAPDELHVHGYDLTFPVESGTQELEFEASTPGVFEIELEQSHLLVAELTVEP